MLALSPKKVSFGVTESASSLEMQRNIYDEEQDIPLWSESLCRDEFLHLTRNNKYHWKTTTAGFIYAFAILTILVKWPFP